MFGKGSYPYRGGPSKNSQEITHKNAIAGALIQHGYDMRLVSTTVESLVHKLVWHSETPIYFGYSKISAIQKLCQEAQIEIPTPVAPSTAKCANGIPSKKRQSTVLNPLDFTVAPGFFLSEDNSAPPVLQSIRAKCMDLVWIRFFHGCVRMLVGKVSYSLEPWYKWRGERFHSLKGPKQAAEEPSVLMAITIFQSDFLLEQWNECLHNTPAFIKKHFDSDATGVGLHSIWGRSLRNGRMPATHQIWKTGF